MLFIHKTFKKKNCKETKYKKGTHRSGLKLTSNSLEGSYFVLKKTEALSCSLMHLESSTVMVTEEAQRAQ